MNLEEINIGQVGLDQDELRYINLIYQFYQF